MNILNSSTQDNTKDKSNDAPDKELVSQRLVEMGSKMGHAFKEDFSKKINPILPRI